MKKCNYCGRYMRNRVMNCFSCGSDNFDSIIDDKIVSIDPPEGGFHVHTDGVMEDIKRNKRLLMIGLSIIPLLLTGIICIWYPFTIIIYSYLVIQIGVISIPLIIIGGTGLKKKKKRLKELEYLKNHGKLVKNQRYKVFQNMNNYFIIDVSFRMDDQAKATHMKSEKIFATELFNDDGLVDVLINPDNYDEHYIAFDIY